MLTFGSKQCKDGRDLHGHDYRDRRVHLHDHRGRHVHLHEHRVHRVRHGAVDANVNELMI